MTFYHYTLKKDLPSILRHGIVPGFQKGPYGNQPDTRGVWLDTIQFNILTPGWFVLTINGGMLDPAKLSISNYRRWHLYSGTIPPEAIGIENAVQYRD